MFTTLSADIRRNLEDYRPRNAIHRWALLCTLNSVHALVLIRLLLWCAQHRIPTLPASKLLFYLFKIDISGRCSIGNGLRIPHPMGIIIAPNSIIGENCDIYADVRLVLSHGSPQGPRIGNGVFLGDGAKVVGNVSVGAHAIIGASSVVTKDIPANCTAAGNPARILKQRAETVPTAA